MNSSRRDFLKSSSLALIGFSLDHRVLAIPSFDIVLKGGTILDGTGGPAWQADIGITGDRIAAIGVFSAEQGARVLDLSGLHVSPGFIDIHSHSDGRILAYSTAESRVMQGVTTEVTGNCGSSAAPFPQSGELRERELESYKDDGIEVTWSDVAGYCRRLEEGGLSINQALLLGQGTLRGNAIGYANRPLTSEEMSLVIRTLEEGLEQGAFGLSTGLEYTPGQFTGIDEIIALARVVARYGGVYASHIRDEESALLEAVAEAITIGRASGARVQISHLKASGQANWHKQRPALDLIESAREKGVEALADAYPYTAYSTGLTTFLPGWAREGGTSAMLKRLRDSKQRKSIREEVDTKIASDLGPYHLIVISRVKTDKNKWTVGETMQAIAEGWKAEPAEALLRLVEEEEGSVSFIGHGMDPANVAMVLAHPLVMIGSDGSSMAPVRKAAESRPHPRSYGAFARVLGYYAREQKLFDLPTAVKKMTSMPADQVGIRDRGRIARNKKADLVVFDAANVRDEATFEDPHRYPKGIVHVLVNGALVVENSKHTGAKPGRALQRT